jgi:hypothetical protein
MASAPRASRSSAGDRLGEFLRAVVVKQREEARGMGAEGLAARRESLEDDADRRHGQLETIAPRRRVGLTGGGEQYRGGR